ncbi:MAG: hypothetical protein M3209_14855 [Acidobacteriota bacterium]|nr:hypothetical protein [Acidobacteriota bacterium]
MPNYAYIDTSAHPAALAYYNTFREEPTGPNHNMRGITGVSMPDITLDNLLDRIIQDRPEGVLIVSHGRDGGLSLRFDTNARQVRATHLALGMLSATDTQTILGRTVQPVSDAEAAQNLGISQELVQRLRGKMRQVRALGIQHVALRACNTGAYPDLLQYTRRFFGSRSVSAPSAQDSYGRFNPGHPTTNQRVWDQWTRAHQNYWIDGTNPNRVAYQIRVNNTNHTFSSAFMADSHAAIRSWIAAQFPNTAMPDPRSSFPIHGIYDNRGAQYPPFAYPNIARYRQLIAREE